MGMPSMMSLSSRRYANRAPMNSCRLYVLAFCCLLLLGSTSKAADTGFPNFSSPDGRFVIRVDYTDDRGLYYVIRDRLGGRTDKSIDFFSRLLWLKWAPDSRTFVTVDHIAGGTIARVMHYQSGRWCVHEVEVPSEDMSNSRVLGVSFEDKVVHLSYKFQHTDKHGPNDGFGLCHFDVDVASGNTSHFVAQSINLQLFVDTPDIKRNF